MTEGTRSSLRAPALKLPVFATAPKARIEAIVSILHDSRKLNRRQAPFSVELARLASQQCRCTGFRFCGHQPNKRESDKENAMHNLKVLTTAVAVLFVTPVFAQEMGGATGPGSAS